MTLPDMPAWATSGTSQKTKPGNTFAAEGYKEGDMPSHNHINWIFYSFYQLCQAIINGELKDITYYTDIATVKAIDTTSMSNHTSVYIQDYGIYFFDSSATIGDIMPTPGQPGAWIFKIPDYRSSSINLQAFFAEQDFQIELIKNQLSEQDARLADLERGK